MKLFPAATYIQRRNELAAAVGSGLLLFMGNDEAPMNFADNHYRFRQDSTFLYYFGIPLAGFAALLDADSGQAWLIGTDFSIDDIIWMGPQPSVAELAERVGVQHTATPSQMASLLHGKEVHFLPPYRFDNQLKLSELTGIAVGELKGKVSEKFVQAVIRQRAKKSAEELEQMEEAVNITRAMHLAAMRGTKVGRMEYEVVADLYYEAKKRNAELAYHAILTINGQTLHNHYHGHQLTAGRLVLNDSGAENEMYYAGDITRTFPVTGQFTQQQREIYNIVLEMEETAIASLKPNVAYRDVHIAANRLMLNRLKEIGLVRGEVEDMLELGVGGLFMPHGLGHMIGLDVHDMEDLGEKLVGYEKGVERSGLLGLKSLRLARPLQEGFVLTVEPGIYFIPELIEKMKAGGHFDQFVNYDKLVAYSDFGGIRIEDNVAITAEGHRVLGERIPKTVEEVETVMKG